jgi:hypothetical protein
VFPATLKEAMTHHVLAKQKKDDCQHDYKQELSNSERGRLRSCRACRIHSCHQSDLSARSGACLWTRIQERIIISRVAIQTVSLPRVSFQLL